MLESPRQKLSDSHKLFFAKFYCVVLASTYDAFSEHLRHSILTFGGKCKLLDYMGSPTSECVAEDDVDF